MRITLETTNRVGFSNNPMNNKAIIETGWDDGDIYDMWYDLIKPVLLAHGFFESSIESLILSEADQIKTDRKSDQNGL